MFSLPDWAFFPLAGAVIAGMIAGALSLGDTGYRSSEQIIAEGVRFDDVQLEAITTGNGLEAGFLIEGQTRIVRITASRGPLDGPQSAGAFYTLLPQEIEALQGHSLEVRFWARSSADNGAEAMRVSLFTRGIGQDSWRRMPVGSEFEEISFSVTPPTCDWTYGYVGAWPDWEFEADTIELRAVEVRALDAVEC